MEEQMNMFHDNKYNTQMYQLDLLTKIEGLHQRVNVLTLMILLTMIQSHTISIGF